MHTAPAPVLGLAPSVPLHGLAGHLAAAVLHAMAVPAVRNARAGGFVLVLVAC